jgi:hypothetical protein
LQTEWSQVLLPPSFWILSSFAARSAA